MVWVALTACCCVSVVCGCVLQYVRVLPVTLLRARDMRVCCVCCLGGCVQCRACSPSCFVYACLSAVCVVVCGCLFGGGSSVCL